MSIVCILWFGAHSTDGGHGTVPSAHGRLPPPLLWLAAKPGAAMLTAATAAAPRARRLLTFNVPPEGHGVAEGGLGDDAGAGLSSPSVLQVLHSKFGHPTHLARKAKSNSRLCSTSDTNPVPFMPGCPIRRAGYRAKCGGPSAGGSRVLRVCRRSSRCSR